MKNQIGPLLVGLGLVLSLKGQNSFSGSFTASYGSSRNNYNFRENYLDVNLYGRAWAGWMQLEYSDPPELGRPLKGLRKFRLEIQRPRYEIQIGDIYEFWGRGLILNQSDNRPIDLDNSFRGLNARINRERGGVDLLGGVREYWIGTYQVPDFNNRRPNYKTGHSLLGTRVSFQGDHLIMGAAWLIDREQHPILFNADFLPDTLTIHHRLIGPYVEWIGHRFDFALEAVFKQTRVQDTLQKGRGVYGEFNHYLVRWSVSLAYKNYLFLRLNPDEQWDTVNHTAGIIPFQQFPTVFHEHSTRLLNRVTHQMDPNDEVGYQIQVSGPVYQQHIFTVELSRASRHHAWAWGPGGDWVKTGPAATLPLKSIPATPFSEWLVEMEGETFQNRFQYSLAFARTSDYTRLLSAGNLNTLNRFYRVSLVRATSIPFQATLSFPDGWSLDLKYEYQRLIKGTWSYIKENNVVVQDTIFSDFVEPTQLNRFISLGVGKAPRWSLSFLIDLSSTEEFLVVTEKEKESKSLLDRFVHHFSASDLAWVSLEGVWNLTERHRLTLMVGSQRGGLLCSNGICRYIQPFQQGIKLGFISLF